ncbi:MAG TPA: phage integrase SAM-like domain-containing protein [Syntrophorhabdales bacterium]|nr:phage integrase SAM-like domain-containing protein [Syntrophorhabdales bacterium]
MSRPKKPKKYGRHEYPELRQAKNGYFYVWYDRWKRDSLKTTDKDIAVQIFALKKREKRDEDLEKLQPKTTKKLAAFETEYVKWRRESGKEANTVRADSLALRLLLESVGDIPLNDITVKDIDQFHAWLRQPKPTRTKTGKAKVKDGCSASTVNMHIRHLKVAFKKALAWGYVVANIYADVKQDKVEEKKVRPLTRDQVNNVLLPVIPAAYDDFKHLIEMYLYLGGRGCEICQADASQIVKSESGRKFLWIPKTKTHKERWVPIPTAALPILDLLPKDGPLWPRWQNVETVSKKLKKYLRACGLGHMWLHGLRHTNISMQIMKGTPTRAVMAIVGQTSEKAMKRYEHLDPDYLAEVSDTLDFTSSNQRPDVTKK